MTKHEDTTAAVGAPFERPVGRLEPERAELRMTTRRRSALAALAAGTVTHPGAQGMCYTLERAGLTEWDKDSNRYRLTAAGTEMLARSKTPND